MKTQLDEKQPLSSIPFHSRLSFAAPTGRTMRGVVRELDRQGARLRKEILPIPSRNEDEVLIQVQASSVHAVDIERDCLDQTRSWMLRPCFVPGCDVAGRVVECDSSSPLRPGDRVMALQSPVVGGAWADYTVCNRDAVVMIPDWMTMAEAAAMPLAGTTALQALRHHGPITSGMRLLVNGANTSIGLMAVQIAKAFGAYVTAVAAGVHKSFCSGIGADSFHDSCRKPISYLGQRWDLIFDAQGNLRFIDLTDCLPNGGRFVSIRPGAVDPLVNLVSRLWSKTGTSIQVTPSAMDLRNVRDLWKAGKINPVIDRAFDMRNIEAAQRHAANADHRGAVVLVRGG